MHGNQIDNIAPSQIVDRLDISKADILIVDDVPENLRLLATILTKEGYQVRKALTGQMALTAVQAVQPDLILVDIMMPQMNGYEVCQQLKSDPQTAGIPVIFLSALNEGFDKAKAFKIGGADYINKPLQIEEVLARVHNQLALKAVESNNQQLNARLEARVQERTHQLEIANQELQREVNKRKLLQTRLLDMALYDTLTGLPNRALFIERLEQALDRASAEPTYQFAVLFLDCDRFKVINDSLGHLVGDELLIAIAYRLKGTLKLSDTLSRFGGDEFAILITDIESTTQIVRVAEQVLQALTHPFRLERHEVFISASVGIAFGHCEYDKPEHLLRDADTAMYRAKASGRARYQVFDSAMHEAALQLLEIETDLRRAIGQQELAVYYQPIVCLSTGKIIGFEALARWHHPQRGLVSPGVFIPVAEETGLISQIDNWVLREACQQVYRWQQEGLTDTPLIISANLSARQFAQHNLIEQIDQILIETDFNPQHLKLEITESAIMDNAESAASILQQLRERQIQLSIDDFGTGYSSLSYLHSFPLNTLKIDRSFVQPIDDAPDQLGLVPLIINIAHTLKMSVVAEGIETLQQLSQLKTLNCDFGQGYLFSRPLPAEQAMHLVASKPQW